MNKLQKYKTYTTIITITKLAVTTLYIALTLTGILPTNDANVELKKL